MLCGGPTLGISVILEGLSVFLLLLFNQSYEIHLHLLAVQDRRGFFQLT
jgi:hypothetical protein